MYRLIRFGMIDLEHYNQVDAVGSGAAPFAYQSLPEGGALDLFGNRQTHPGAVERTKSLRLRGDTEATLETLYFELLAARGKRDRLYRRTAIGDIHWQYARLAEVAAHRSYEQTKYRFIQDLELRFATQEAFWRGNFGGAWNLDSGEYLDAGLAFDSAETYNLDGSESKNMMMGRGGQTEQVSKAKFDGNKLVITTTTANGENTQSWYMEGDHLVNERTGGQGNVVKTYYKKAM
ncbi:MAG: hypothetical protein DYH08_15890 [Actinobacteria bacterium ATB1]|nr:hypothetical protein [Actinobacteria bacterium ATB1]